MTDEKVPSLQQIMQERQEKALIAEIVRDSLIEAANEYGGLYIREPFPREGELADIFLLWLQPVEFRLAWALQFAYLDTGQMKNLPVNEAFRAVITRLEHEYGYDWNGLDSNPDGEIFAARRKPLSPGNANWIAMLGVYDKPPDYLDAFNAAIQWCEQNSTLRDLLPMLKEVKARILTALDRVELTEEEKETWRRLTELESAVEKSKLPAELVAQIMEDIQ